MAVATSNARVSLGGIEVDDPGTWDELASGLGGQHLQAWAWGELKSHFGWQPLRLISADRHAAAQLLFRSMAGLAAAYVPRGPLYDGNRLDPGFLDELVRRARSRRAAFLRLEPAVAVDDLRAVELDTQLRAAGFRPTTRTLQLRSSVAVEIDRPLDELFRDFSKGHRADVKRGERNGVTVREGTSAADFELLEHMLLATQERKKFTYHNAEYYRNLWQAFGDAARLFVAQHNGQDVAAALVVGWHEFGSYLVAGSTGEALDLRAVHVLQWHAICWARERGVKTWDLGGMADARGAYELAATEGGHSDAELEAMRHAAEADPLDGVYRFKKGWGGHVVRTLPAYDRVFIPPAYWFWLRRLSG
jgi:serine/alanine adding enzyme